MKLPFSDWLYTDCQYSSMSLIESNDNLSIGPLSVLTTLPVGLGAFRRGPLGPLVAGMPPTRNGSLSMDRARPLTTVLQPATTSTAPAQAIAALRRRPRARLFMMNLIPTGLHGSIKRDLILDPLANVDSRNESRGRGRGRVGVTRCETS